jgi:alkylation response protein AidB-like acyl-CoA dehydrogenase
MYLLNDPNFGHIVDFDLLRRNMKLTYDLMYPDFNMLAVARSGGQLYENNPSYLIAGGASTLAYSMLLAAEEYELAEELKPYLFTLGWTEEAVGSDLLSVTTTATLDPSDPEGKAYHVKGKKWLINNSYHADYHLVVAKIDPKQNGPRSLSLFLVPRSSTNNWERLETHVLENMVLTTFDIDGPARLVGKIGHGLTILQRMAMPSKYICTYVGVDLLNEAVQATLHHLSTKRIFDNEPIRFSNVFRQMYSLALRTAFYNFIFYRSVVFSDTSFLSFHGTFLKSFLLLRINEALSENLLVAGSKGFLHESVIGRNAFDSFVLPVFDGHYTINTLMSAKHIDRYLAATRSENMSERINLLREKLFVEEVGNQINAKPSEIRHPDFFDVADYWQQLSVPMPLDMEQLRDSVRQLVNEIEERKLSSEAEYKYKVGVISHWLEAVLASGEFWKVMGDDVYLNVVVQTYNGLVNAFNNIVSEGALNTDYLQPMRYLPIPEFDKEEDFLANLMNIQERLAKVQAVR